MSFATGLELCLSPSEAGCIKRASFFFFSSHTVLHWEAEANISHSLSIWCVFKPTATCKFHDGGSVLASSLEFLHISLSPGSRAKYRRTAFACILQFRWASRVLPTTHTFPFAHTVGTKYTTLALVPRSSRWRRECNQNVTFCLLIVFYGVLLSITLFHRLAIRQTMKGRRARTQTGWLFQSVDKWWEQIHVRVKGQEHSLGAADNHST